MVYRLNTGVEYPVKQQIKAVALTLLVTVGVPALASLVHNYNVIFPGPSIVRSNESLPRTSTGEPVTTSQTATNSTGEPSPQNSSTAPMAASLSPTTAATPVASPEPTSAPVGGFGGGDGSGQLPSTEPAEEEKETPIPPVEDEPTNPDIQIQTELEVGTLEAQTTLTVEGYPPEADAELEVEY